MSLTFAQSLFKYRADQRRGKDGKWEDEGGGNDAAAYYRAKLKPRMGIRGRKQILQEVVASIRSGGVGDVIDRMYGNKPQNRAAETADLRRFAQELEQSIAALEAKAKGEPSADLKSLTDLMTRYRRKAGLSTKDFISELHQELGTQMRVKVPKATLSSGAKYVAFARKYLSAAKIENGFARVTDRYA